MNGHIIKSNFWHSGVKRGSILVPGLGHDSCSTEEAFPTPLFGLTPGYPRFVFSFLFPRPVLLGVTLYSDRVMILVLHSLTPEKVGLPGSELPRSRSVVTSHVNNGSTGALRSVLWNEMETFH